MLRLTALLLLVVVPLEYAMAQPGQPASASPASFSMRGTHTVVFDAGSWSLASSTASNTNVSEQQGGFVGSVTHKFWLTDRWSIGPSISILDTGVKTLSTSGNGARRSVLLTTILIGVNRAFILSQDRVNVMFYVSASLGPYMTSTAPEDPQVKSTSLTAFGVRPSAGMHWFLTDWLLFDFGAGYHQVSDFSEPLGKYNNFSGLEFSMGLGLAL